MLVLLSSLAFAADRVEGSETLAVGSTAVANPWANAGIAANPSLLAVEERYDFGVAGSYGGHGFHWNITAADSRTSAVGFGLSYSGDRYSPALATHELPGWSVEGQELTNRKRNQDVGAGLSIPFLQRRLALGFGGSLTFYNHDRQGKGIAGNATAGLSVKPVDGVVIGVSGRNLLPVVDPDEGRPLEVLGGVWLGEPSIGSLSLEGGIRPERDALLVLGAGAEARLGDGAAVRGGWRLEDAQHNLTLGAGAGTREAGIDVGIAVPAPSLLKPVDWTLQLSVRFQGPDPDSIRPD